MALLFEIISKSILTEPGACGTELFAIEFEGLDVSQRLFLPADMLETQGKGQIMVMPLSELRQKNMEEGTK